MSGGRRWKSVEWVCLETRRGLRLLRTLVAIGLNGSHIFPILSQKLLFGHKGEAGAVPVLRGANDWPAPKAADICFWRGGGGGVVLFFPQTNELSLATI